MALEIYESKFRCNIWGLINFQTTTTFTDLTKYYHVVLTKETGYVNIYVNNVLENSFTDSTSFDTETSKLYIGHSAYSTHNSTSYLDDFRIYNKVLTAEQVNLLYTTNDNVIPPAINYAGGGGGSASSGTDATTLGGGKGGAGLYYSITTINTEYGKGGNSFEGFKYPEVKIFESSASAFITPPDTILSSEPLTDMSGDTMVGPFDINVDSKDYVIYTFKYNSEYSNLTGQSEYSFNLDEEVTADILIVGGGGAGSAGHGGGGGAGQLVFIHEAILNGSYNIKVGKGGIGGISYEVLGGRQATKGFNSSFDTIIAEAGGTNTGITSDKNGGSGAGGDGWISDGGTAGKGVKDSNADTYSSGNVYSKGNDGAEQVGAIGGGGGGAGTSASGNSGGDGVSGISEISFDFKTNVGNIGILENDGLVYLAGGGGGGGGSIGSGGKGGGSDSGNIYSTLQNTGGGGGGGAGGSGAGGNGGSGIVIIRFPKTSSSSYTPPITSSLPATIIKPTTTKPTLVKNNINEVYYEFTAQETIQFIETISATVFATNGTNKIEKTIEFEPHKLYEIDPDTPQITTTDNSATNIISDLTPGKTSTITGESLPYDNPTIIIKYSRLTTYEYGKGGDLNTTGNSGAIIISYNYYDQTKNPERVILQQPGYLNPYSYVWRGNSTQPVDDSYISINNPAGILNNRFLSINFWLERDITTISKDYIFAITEHNPYTELLGIGLDSSNLFVNILGS